MEADHGAWISARVDGTEDHLSRKLAVEIAWAYDLTVTCEVCNANVSELRRGRCWGCYARWVDMRPVGMGAQCLACGEKRRRVLKSVELFGGWKPMCFNCAGQLLALSPMPASIAGLRAAISRERRMKDRRLGKPDTRVFKYERRVGERRMGREDVPLVDDDMIIEITIDPTDDADVTRIHELYSEGDAQSSVAV